MPFRFRSYSQWKRPKMNKTGTNIWAAFKLWFFFCQVKYSKRKWKSRNRKEPKKKMRTDDKSQAKVTTTITNGSFWFRGISFFCWCLVYGLFELFSTTDDTFRLHTRYVYNCNVSESIILKLNWCTVTKTIKKFFLAQFICSIQCGKR